MPTPSVAQDSLSDSFDTGTLHDQPQPRNPIRCADCGKDMGAVEERAARYDYEVIISVSNGTVNLCGDCFRKRNGTRAVTITNSVPFNPHPFTKATPIRQQYLDLKAQYPNAVLLFRLGDFYETFDEDAERAGKACDLVVTTRPISRTERIPMAGFPFHALERYIELLTKAGHNVAVAEQMGEPQGGLVERKVTRVVYHDEPEAMTAVLGQKPTAEEQPALGQMRLF